jgi:tetratricopeptide (TPR) repeat protein
MVALALTMLCVGAGTAPAASAADGGTLGPDHQSNDPTLRGAYDRAFQAMLADPGNLDKAFAFADLAIQTGDLEGAIAAMERMLLVDPNLPWVRLELGVLYFRLGSFEVARTYLQHALTAPNLPPAVRDRIRALLAQIEQQKAALPLGGAIASASHERANLASDSAEHSAHAATIPNFTSQDRTVGLQAAWRRQK